MSSLPTSLHCVLALVLGAPGLAQGGGWLGVALDPERDQPTIVEVVPDSPAERAGLAPGDRIAAIGGETLASVADLARALSRRDVGAEVRIDVRRRGGRLESVVVRLGRRPSVAAGARRPVPPASTSPPFAHGARPVLRSFRSPSPKTRTR